MNLVACRNRNTGGQALAGVTAVLGLLIVMQITGGIALAEGQKNSALRFLLDKGIITQQEYDHALEEERQQEEQQHKKVLEAFGKQPVPATTTHGIEFKMGGFAELDFIGDNTRSFGEIVGNGPVLRSDTLAGANSQLVFSPRNSRLKFDVRAPEQNGIKSRFFASIDFFGSETAVSPTGNSQFSAQASPTARIFQLFFVAETPVVDVKIGQDWSQFGFMSQYSRGQVSTAATPANMFNRWIQASVSKRLRVTDTVFLTPVFSVERPPQADANLPSLVAGVQLAYQGLQAPYTGAQAADTTLKPLSLQISGVGRRLEANTGGPTTTPPGTQATLSSQTYVTGWGVSSSVFLPILPSRDGGMGHTAHIVMEGVTGAGIADFFNQLSWGVCNPTCGTSTTSGFGGASFGQTNLDGGLAAVSSQTGQFEAIRTTSMMVHGTYYLPDDAKTWVGGGYGTIYSSNANQMTCTAPLTPAQCGGATRTLSSIYTRDATYYGYLYHDFTQQIRAGLETNFFRTTYADGAHAENRRVMVSLYWRF